LIAKKKHPPGTKARRSFGIWERMAHSSCRLWTSKRRIMPSAFALRATANKPAPIRPVPFLTFGATLML
jgi:hypothetical protein